VRPISWTAVGLSSDPVPGDPSEVRAGGRHYVDVADTLASAANRIRSFETGGDTVSQAVDALVENQTKVADHLDTAEGRYRATGEGLLTYAPVLEQVQARADSALADARAAHDAYASAAADSRRYLHLSFEATEPTAALRYRNLADSAGDDQDAAARRVADARATVDDAVAQRDRAAEEATGRIHSVVDHDGLNDSWWDDWGADVVAAITNVAGWVSTITGVLALLVCWIPVIGQALAGALLLVSAIAAVVNAVGNIALASTGERSWTEAVISIAGAALACIGLGGTARVVAGAVTRRVLVSEAERGLTAAGRAAGSLEIMTKQATEAASAFGVRDLLRTKPADLWESARLWTGRAPGELKVGDGVFRVYGDEAGRGGLSWTTMDPRTLVNYRTALGLPGRNSGERVLAARVASAENVLGARRALPLAGNPGGAPEYLIAGDLASGEKGLVEVFDVVFSVP
jgi:hypothetical protein